MPLNDYVYVSFYKIGVALFLLLLVKERTTVIYSMFLTRHICLSSIGGAYVQKEEASGDRPLTSPKARTRNKSSSESPASGSCYIRIL